MKCRFAPSPTGNIHIGNARSAILNWIFCKKHNGEFVLRIDDTDQSRSSKAFEDAIKSDLKWLGLDWSYTFNQSTRNKIYDDKINCLKNDKRLYPCFETEEELRLMRQYYKKGGKTKKKKSKSRVNEAGNYTKPGLRKRIFNRIKAGGKGGKPGQWSARKAQMVAAAYKKAGGGYRD